MPTVEIARTTSRRVPTWVLVLVVPVLAVAAVFITRPSWSAPAATPIVGSHVRIVDFAFSPAEVRVAPGAEVEVTNADSTTHTLSASDGAFNTSKLAPGAHATISAPTTPGRYKFVCQIHPSMVGTLVVTRS